jgi:hypothetical protein
MSELLHRRFGTMFSLKRNNLTLATRPALLAQAAFFDRCKCHHIWCLDTEIFLCRLEKEPKRANLSGLSPDKSARFVEDKSCSNRCGIKRICCKKSAGEIV